jgi:hypothetical protein
MIITKMSLPRRTFLRGVGASLALPLLDAMVPALTAMSNTPARPVKRFGVVYVPNGVAMKFWTPANTGGNFAFSPILEGMAPFRDRLLVISGLNGAGGAAHTGASTEFLTGVKVDVGSTAGTSVDQLLANEFGRETQLASLELALDPRDGTGSCDGQSCALSNSIAWRTPTLLLPMEDDPRAVFERMFGDGGSTDSTVRQARLQKDRSILDSVTQTVADLQRALGAGDRRKIVEYLESVRDVERRIQRAQEQSSRELPLVSQPSGIPPTFEEHAKLMFDLQLLAFQIDLTRITTFMIGREYSGRTYSEIGISDAHHPLSHHQNDPERYALNAKLNAYHLSMFTYYLEKLRATPDGDGTLLDHTLLLYGSGMSDGNAHSHVDIPLLLVGGPSFFKGGRHLKYAGDPASNLLRTIMDKMGVPIEQIGDSKGELDIDSERLSDV